MDETWQIFGHQNVKSILGRQLLAQRFPHAYLFSGPQGLGKRTLALEFAKKILGTEKLENHPDFAILDEPGEITMDSVLRFLPKLSYKPFLAGYKVAIINNAQNFNQQSGNALLKTLEEASPSSIIILLANSLRILPTIVSRCQVLAFSAFGKNDLEGFAKAIGIRVGADQLELSFGKPARLKKLCEDKDFFKAEQETVGKYRALRKMRIGEKLNSISGLAELEAADLERNLWTWLMWQKDRLHESPQDFAKVRVLADSITGLKQNKNKKLIIQGLLLRI